MVNGSWMKAAAALNRKDLIKEPDNFQCCGKVNYPGKGSGIYLNLELKHWHNYIDTTISFLIPIHELFISADTKYQSDQCDYKNIQISIVIFNSCTLLTLYGCDRIAIIVVRSDSCLTLYKA